MMYDGALVMPRNCVAMTEDEMMYVEGGSASISTLVGNLKGILAMKLTAALAGTGLTTGMIGKVLANTLTWAYVNVAAVVGRVAAIIGGIIVGVIAAVGAALAVKYLASHRVFY